MAEVQMMRAFMPFMAASSSALGPLEMSTTDIRPSGMSRSFNFFTLCRKGGVAINIIGDDRQFADLATVFRH